MLIRHMSAVFGKLQNQTLDLCDGLNILQAPGEDSISSWCAFLLSMFYGASTEEGGRSAAVSGRLDCRAGDDALVLLRSAHGSNAPEEFQALYAGTTTPVPGLDSGSCGDTLLGVSREVFARAAFIRQNSMVQAGPDRRTGNSGKAVSVPHTEDGGPIALEAELQETESLLAIQGQLTQKLSRLQSQIAAEEARAAALEAELTALDYQEAQQQRQALERAEEDAVQAEQRAESLRRRITEEAVPETGDVSRLRGAIVNLGTVRKAADKAQTERDAAERALRQAEEAAAGSPFAGLTPEEAEQRTMELPPKPRYPLWGLVLALLLGLGLGAALFAKQPPLLAIGCGCGLAGAILLLTGFLIKKRQGRWESMASERRAQWQAALETHAALCRALDAAQAENDEKSAAFDALDAPLRTHEEGILQEIRRFAPSVADITAADAALRASAVLRKALAEADAAARDARQRRDLLAQQIPETTPVPPAGAAAASRDRSVITAALEETRSGLAALRADAAQLSSRLQAAGDPAALRAAAEKLADRISALEKEASAQDGAPSIPQLRSTSALRRRAAEIFAVLTAGAYSDAALDWKSLVAAELSAGGVPADVLPDGTAEPLHLAVRLAICQLALPEEKKVPIILDDALANFDGERCAAVLHWLRKEAEGRQVLLFTSRSREAAFFAGDPSVSIQYLTDQAKRV